MKFHTDVCDILEIEYPIVLAGMGGASTPELAAAVSNAGGLGVLGASTWQFDQLREKIEQTRALTDKPFGVDTLLPASVRRAAETAGDGPSPADQLAEQQAFARDFMVQEGLDQVDMTAVREAAESRRGKNDLPVFSKEFFDAQMEVIIQERVPVYAAGLGNPGPWMDELHAGGAKVMAVVGATKHAIQVAASGLDVIVAQGHDGGGHNARVGTMALIPQVVDAAAGIPILAAGGITDGRGVAAAMMLGAQGAWIGTAFLAAEESGIADYQKQALIDATDDGTIVSRSVTGKPARLIRNKWADAYENADIDPLPMPYQGMVSGAVTAAAGIAKRADIAPGFAGQGTGLIKAVRPAREIFDDILAQAEETLSQAGNFFVN